MGMLANYMMVDEQTLGMLMDLDAEELLEEIEELDESGAEVYDMDKLWDGLHYLLTGVSASQPIEGNKLSEAIVGIHLFNEDSEDFIAYIKFEELPDIISEMEKVSMEDLLQDVNFSSFNEENIYPDIWPKNNNEQLKNELKSEFLNLLSFYKEAIADKTHIVVSIY